MTTDNVQKPEGLLVQMKTSAKVVTDHSEAKPEEETAKVVGFNVITEKQRSKLIKQILERTPSY